MVTNPPIGFNHAFVTGATGMVGTPLCSLLIELGVTVTAFTRNSAEHELPSVNYVRGDILDQNVLRDAAKGADVIFHIAAAVHGSADTYEGFETVNVQGTANVVQIAKDIGAKLIHVSSVNVDSYRRGHLLDNYAATKSEGEQLVSDAATSGLDAVIVRPGTVFGNVEGRSGLIVDRILSKRLKILPAPSRKISPVWSNDLARALVGAASFGEQGGIYTVAGPTISTGDFVATICRITGLGKPILALPAWILAIPLRLAWWGSKITRWNPPFSVESMLVGSVYDGSDAAKCLQFEYSNLEDIFD